MREKENEKKLVKAVQKKGGLAPKFVAPGFDGMPDRLVLMKGGKMAFVEVKAGGKKLRALQCRRKRQLEKLGFLSFVLDHETQIDGIIAQIEQQGIGGDVK